MNLVDANVEFQINKRQGLNRNKMTDFGTGDGRIWVSADTPWRDGGDGYKERSKNGRRGRRIFASRFSSFSRCEDVSCPCMSVRAK